MPYASYTYQGVDRVGRVDGDTLIPLDLPALGSSEALQAAAELPAEAVAVADVHLRPVIRHPDKIICVGLNYHAHVGETGRELPTYPVMFTKYASSLIGANDDIILPPESNQVDYEAELTVVIGRAGRRIPLEKAYDHVLGYTVANDITMRDYQYKTHQWLQGKAWDNSTPLGPYLVLPQEVDLTSAGIRTRLGDRVLQSSDLSKLIFDIPTLISTVSEFTTLLPGDLILTGTPGGVGYRRDPQLFLQNGDEITVEVDGVGTLSNRVRSE
ncbi:fumarylacetoacetate hydrolase family protein [Kibdelosporangium philippinense]|uniref:Fumarylacetoacetate hydrolase family protein n=1 Tax=Kibdelosporangium philippinense TaxID=211113 RepID=A0ABS8ZTM0_9PSEU|nr:fumarylacetoacetate hydrolase family protein [Kibdelosporangium philippinense]MCE7011074.1 fumarylacetoacetate hydrolase family protein [Kibdelosporangium philippinense]